MLANDDVEIAVAVEVCNIEAHRADYRANVMPLPQLRGVGALLVPNDITRLADRFKPDHGIEPTIAVDVRQTISIRIVAVEIYRVDTPVLALIAQPTST